MKNYFKYLCFAGCLGLLTVAGCSSEDDDDNMTPDVEEEPVVTGVSFASQIKLIIENNCAPCHISGGTQTDYTVFANAEGNASGIINRINRDEGTAGFMPNGGTKLSDEQLALIQQWQDDGLNE